MTTINFATPLDCWRPVSTWRRTTWPSRNSDGTPTEWQEFSDATGERLDGGVFPHAVTLDDRYPQWGDNSDQSMFPDVSGTGWMLLNPTNVDGALRWGTTLGAGAWRYFPHELAAPLLPVMAEAYKEMLVGLGRQQNPAWRDLLARWGDAEGEMRLRDEEHDGTVECDNCCDTLWSHEPRWTLDDAQLCTSCFPTRPISCDECGGWELVQDSRWDSHRGRELCGGCYSSRYQYRCPECGDEFDDEDAARRCCYRGGRINSYSYRPPLEFHGVKSISPLSDKPTGPLYLGFELEVECPNDVPSDLLYDTAENFVSPGRQWVAEEVDRHFGEFLYCKSDGSLSNGVEIVSHPATLEAHAEKRDAYKGMLRELRKHGVRSWDTTSCGIHVHLSRDAFSEPLAYKWLKFIYGNRPALVRLAGRESRSYASFGGMRDRDCRYYANTVGGERYKAINCQNEATYELRIFRGSLKHDTLMGAIELADATYHYCRTVLGLGEAYAGDVDFQRFTDWVGEMGWYPSLEKRIEERLAIIDCDV